MKWLMLSWLVICLGLSFLFLQGCACPCPKQDLYFIANMEDGRSALIDLEKGYFDNRKAWLNQEQRDELIEGFKRYQQQLREQRYDEQFGTE